MTWAAPPRPEWVEAINAGSIVPLATEAALPFDRDALLGEARARQGRGSAAVGTAALAEFGQPGFEAEALVDPLDRLVAALEAEAELTIVGRWLARRFVLRILEVRLQLMDYLRQDPGVLDEPIEAPIFIAGAPRTGTTILHALLAADPAHRVPLGWELLRPVPPPSEDPTEFAADPRIELADRELVLPQTVVSGLLAIHVYGARKPKECLSAMSFALQSEEFTARYRVPSYEAWLHASDMRPAYEMHRLVLQVLQRRTGPSAWVLKSPVHLHSLPTLFGVYPDARVAVTHRDPLTVLASLTSLIATLRWAHSDAVDYGEIGAGHARRFHASLDRLAQPELLEKLPAEQMHHSRFCDFMEDPLAVVAAFYERFGSALPRGVEEQARAALTEPPSGEHGAHEYSFDSLGLDRTEQRRAFRRYQAAFSVPDEE